MRQETNKIKQEVTKRGYLMQQRGLNKIQGTQKAG